MDTHHNIFVQTQRMCNTKSESKYFLWVIMIYQCSFINFNKHTTLVEDVENGRCYAYVGSSRYEKSVPLPQHFFEPKTSQKNLKYNFIK